MRMQAEEIQIPSAITMLLISRLSLYGEDYSNSHTAGSAVRLKRDFQDCYSSRKPRRASSVYLSTRQNARCALL
jgi:hypothetical protein